MVQELLKFKSSYGRPDLLVRWAGRNASGHTWEPLDSLTDCAEAVSAFKRASGRVLPRPTPPPPAAAAAAAAAHSACRFHRGLRASQRPGRRARWPDAAPSLLVVPATTPGGSAAPWHASARALLFRMSWRIRDRYRRCASARRGRLAAGCGVLRHPMGAFGGPGPSGLGVRVTLRASSRVTDRYNVRSAYRARPAIGINI